MTPARKIICTIAAFAAVLAIAGCAAPPVRLSQLQAMPQNEPASLHAIDSQIIDAETYGTIQLGAADSVGGRMFDHYKVIVWKRHLDEMEMLAGVDAGRE